MHTLRALHALAVTSSTARVTFVSKSEILRIELVWIHRYDRSIEQTCLLVMQEDQAFGNVPGNAAPTRIPHKLPHRVGVGIPLNACVQVAPLHVLQHQHGAAGVQAGAVELHNVSVKGQRTQQANLLHKPGCSVMATTKNTDSAEGQTSLLQLCQDALCQARAGAKPTLYTRHSTPMLCSKPWRGEVLWRGVGVGGRGWCGGGIERQSWGLGQPILSAV